MGDHYPKATGAGSLTVAGPADRFTQRRITALLDGMLAETAESSTGGRSCTWQVANR